MSLDTTRAPDAYRIRHFRERDTDPLLSLHASVFDREWGRAWFRWKFVDNPYVDHVPILVATRDGEIVGCRAFFALELRIDGETRLAFQPCDTMVHPDHRRRGLFSRMNERALEYYAERSPALCFNFPNQYSKPGNLKHGWREIGTVPMYYRLQDPAALADAIGVRDSTREEPAGEGETGSRDDGSGAATSDGGRADGGVATTDERSVDDGAATSGGAAPTRDERTTLNPTSLGARAASEVKRTLSGALSGALARSDELTATWNGAGSMVVERHETPPYELLEFIYRQNVPDAIHANRTSEFYRWRLSNPSPEYVTYVGRVDGEAVAAVVISPVGDDLRIVESLPRAFDDRREELATLVRTVLCEYGDRSYASAFGETIPSALRHRFYPDTRLPLSAVIRPTTRTLLARGLDSELDVEARPIDDWRFTRLDLDTA
ncbi:GNAT family N-acetyltransferase [Halovivax gelatinilyticus]|uniref:GNAT family N-acetyltransferase n=1 Tax=Halovivax gelatinilyticus TaxID=2961597 RepID=UPI0020CA66B5|nr:GNAT family N-acetyltransferase [Halovivax gelatinilyticus]